MSDVIVILLGIVIFMLLVIGLMIKQISKDVAQIYGALFIKGYLKGADNDSNSK